MQRSRGTHAEKSRRASCSAARIAVVDQAIAIVIDPVACFHGRRGRLQTNFGAGIALHGARRANARKSRVACGSLVGKYLVDQLIAIIVDTIAAFGGRLFRHACRRNAIVASGHGDRTCAHAARHRSDVVVNDAIAIVILAIADFAPGRHVIQAIAQHPQIAQLFSGFADADIQRFRRSRVAILHDAVDTRATIVDHPVAIVINHSVADFDVRQSGLTRIFRAAGDHDLTSAYAAGLRRNAVVDLTIAIVVDVVACFGFGALSTAIDFDFVAILHPVGARRGDAFFIRAHAARTRRTIGAYLSVRTRLTRSSAAIGVGFRAVFDAVTA